MGLAVVNGAASTFLPILRMRVSEPRAAHHDGTACEWIALLHTDHRSISPIYDATKRNECWPVGTAANRVIGGITNRAMTLPILGEWLKK
jgi:4'-phosphopantetheinyl transferase EntD